MSDDTRIGVGLLWLMEGNDIEKNVRLALQHHLARFGYAAEYGLMNPVDLPMAMEVDGVPVRADKSTQARHVFVGKKVPRSVRYE